MRVLTNLSPYDFELLMRDLLRADRGLRFEAFAPGRDGGVDLRARGDIGRVVVQCKHTPNARRGDLLKMAKAECRKVMELGYVPDLYIFATSAGLSPEIKDAIGEVFEEQGIRWEVLGGEDIDGLLALHTTVEAATPKLWAESAAVLTEVFAAAIVGRSDVAIRQMKTCMETFVPTAAFFEARRKLSERGCIVLQGAAGMGKTSLAYALAAEYMRNGTRAVFVSADIDEAFQIVAHQNGPFIVVYDDFLGQSTSKESLAKNEDARLGALVALAHSSDRVRLIVTTRDYILRNARADNERLDAAIRDMGDVYVDVDNIDLRTRAHILFNHISNAGLDSLEIESFGPGVVRQILEHRNFSPRLLAELPDLAEASPGPHLAAALLAGLDQPTRLWSSVLRSLPDECLDLVIVMATLPDDVDVDDVIEATRAFRMQRGVEASGRRLREVVQLLEPTFALTTAREVEEHGGRQHRAWVSFANPSVRDFAMARLAQMGSGDVADLVRGAAFWEQLTMLYAAAWGSSDELTSQVAGILEVKGDRTSVDIRPLRATLRKESVAFARRIDQLLADTRLRTSASRTTPVLQRLSHPLLAWPEVCSELTTTVELRSKLTALFDGAEPAARIAAVDRLLASRSDDDSEAERVRFLRPICRAWAASMVAELPCQSDIARSEWWAHLVERLAARSISAAGRLADEFGPASDLDAAIRTAADREARALLDEIEVLVGMAQASVAGPHRTMHVVADLLRFFGRAYVLPEGHELSRLVTSFRQLLRTSSAAELPLRADGSSMFVPDPDALTGAIDALDLVSPWVTFDLEPFRRTLELATATAEAGRMFIQRAEIRNGPMWSEQQTGPNPWTKTREADRPRYGMIRVAKWEERKPGSIGR